MWVIFALLDPEPDSGSGSTDPIEYGSNTDPDPQPWIFDQKNVLLEILKIILSLKILVWLGSGLDPDSAKCLDPDPDSVNPDP